jgi:hypothetical protein
MTLRRIGQGSRHRYELDGEPCAGVTTILQNGYPKPALIGWAANTTAAYAVEHWSELAELGLVARLDLLKRARNLDRGEAANRGTQVHALAQQLARGATVDVPEPLAGIVDSYLRFAEEWQVRELLVEASCGSRRPRYAGTLDLVAELVGDQRWLLDFKTGAKDPRYPDTALQLAAYRHAEFYLDAQGIEQPMLEVDRAGIVWLRADGYDLIPVETGKDVYRTFLYVREVAAYRASNDVYPDPSPIFGDLLAPPPALEEAS